MTARGWAIDADGDWRSPSGDSAVSIRRDGALIQTVDVQTDTMTRVTAEQALAFVAVAS